MSDYELAWAAGFFDGEGNVRAPIRRLEISISQTDLRPLERFKDAVGVGRLHGPYDMTRYTNGVYRRPLFTYKAGGEDAEIIGLALWPWLSAPKRDQFQKATEFRDAGRPVGERGHRRSVV